MKKFEFTLDKIRNYRQQILDREKNTLGALRSQLSMLEKQLEEIKVRLNEASEKLREMYSGGVTVTDISVHKRYITTLQQEIRLCQQAIRNKEKEIENQLQVVVAATQEVSKLEKLEDKQLEEYNHLAQKEEELFIEEFVSNSAFYEN